MKAKSRRLELETPGRRTVTGFFRTTYGKELWPLVVALLVALPAVVRADFNYTTNNGTITITEYTGPGGAVVIPDSINGLPVTSIGDSAFAFQSLTSVTIPNSVTNIGEEAFQGCTDLTGVNIPNGVTTIGEDAFSDCYSLTAMTIPASVTSIGSDAFAACSSLSAITVDALNPAFSSVDGVLFNKSQTLLIQCPGGRAGSYTIPNSVTSIGEDAFSGCTNLTSITIPNSVTNIGEDAFQDCESLTSLMIPSSVTSIGEDAFSSCLNLSAITVSALNPAYSSVDGVLFSKNQTLLIQYPAGRAGSYTVPASVASIGNNAFQDCFSLTAIYFQGDAPSISEDAFESAENVIAYYLPGTTGWGMTFAGRPAVLLNALMVLTSSLGVLENGFEFTFTGASNLVVVVEAATNLVSPVWVPVGTNTLTGGTSYFSDPGWTNHPARFYRLRSP